MRIAMIGQRNIPANHGGVERAVEELSARLAADGHTVDVFVGRNDTTLKQHRAINIRRIPVMSGKYSRALSQSIVASCYAVFGKYDIVHYHAMGPSVSSPLLRLSPKTRIICTVQGRDDRRAKWGFVARQLIALGAWCTANVAHATIVVSRELQNDYKREFRRDTTYIPNGVSAPAHPGALTALPGFGLTEGKYLLNVGRLVPEKGVDLLVQAYRNVDTDWPVVIVGGSSSTDGFVDDVNKLAEGDPRVMLTGPVYGAELTHLFQGAGGFVFPSKLEGLPIALLEACSYGLPVVLSDIGPNREVAEAHLGSGVYLHRSNDQQDLTDAISRFLSDDPVARSEGAAKLRDDVLRRFSWESVVEQTEEVYATVSARNPAKRGFAGAPLGRLVRLGKSVGRS